jgi:Ca2+-binding RTX toxin-like protein
MTWPGFARPIALGRFAAVLAIACLGTAASADATVTASIVGSELRVTGDAAGDDIRLRLSGDGLRVEVFVNSVLLNSFLHTSFTSIRVDAGGGDDHVHINETNGAFTTTETTTLLGGDGNDLVAGGTGAETIRGGAGDDVLWGFRGADDIFGDAGDDLINWRSGATLLAPSDGDDTIDGGAGTDTLDVVGSTLSEVYSLVANGHGVLFSRNVLAMSMDIRSTERLELDMEAGNDTFVPPPGLPTLNTFAVVGGDGNDTISGGNGDDLLIGADGDDTISGGPGDDSIHGHAGADVLFGDAGNDLLIGYAGDDTIHGNDGDDIIRWDHNSGSDVVNGLGGVDTLIIDGTINADTIRVSPNGARVRVLREGIFTTQDLGTVERLEIGTGGGDDAVVLHPNLDGLLQGVAVALGAGNDTFISTATSPPAVVDGGPAEVDIVNFAGGFQPVGHAPPTISVNGVPRVIYTEIESIIFVTITGTMPSIAIAAPTSAASTTAWTPFITLAGTAADAQGIQSIGWSNDRGGSGVAAGTTAWTAANVPLQSGTNVISMTVVDTNGNSSTDTLAVDVSMFSYSLAEGATGSFFDLDVLIANPTTTPAPVTVTFFREDGSSVTQIMTLPSTSRTTIHADAIAGLESQGGVSTVVTSTSAVPLVVERTMFWDASGYGSHGGTAVDGPRTRWLFAEGSEGFFNTFVLLANSGSTASNVTLTFLREGSTPFTRVVSVPPTSRVTVAANGIPELVGRSFSIVVDATAPIIAERAMYFGAARLFDGGHESTGVSAGAMSWFLAEGATGPFFETFVLVGNPNPVAANVTFTFLTGTGQTVVRSRTVPANGRLTVNVEYEDPILANAAVSTTIASDQPVIAERAMYWPGPPSTWTEAHNSFGSTALSTRWGLAEGRAGMAQAFQTYILLANPGATAANVQITFLRQNGSTVVKTFTVAPTSRFNVDVSSAVPELQNEGFGALIEVTNGVGISVERAMYSDALGQTWAAGTNALATRLP